MALLEMKVTFKILRQKPDFSPKFQSYTIEVNKGNTILECLDKIKWELDGSLTFRKNCRNTICGSCAVKINGRSALACKENVGGEIEKNPLSKSQNIPEIVISPLNNLPVLKDLVVDMSNFWQDLEKNRTLCLYFFSKYSRKRVFTNSRRKKIIRRNGQLHYVWGLLF